MYAENTSQDSAYALRYSYTMLVLEVICTTVTRNFILFPSFHLQYLFFFRLSYVYIVVWWKHRPKYHIVLSIPGVALIPYNFITVSFPLTFFSFLFFSLLGIKYNIKLAYVQYYTRPVSVCISNAFLSLAHLTPSQFNTAIFKLYF